MNCYGFRQTKYVSQFDEDKEEFYETEYYFCLGLYFELSERHAQLLFKELKEIELESFKKPYSKKFRFFKQWYPQIDDYRFNQCYDTLNIVWCGKINEIFEEVKKKYSHKTKSYVFYDNLELISNDLRKTVYNTKVMNDLKAIYSFERLGWQKCCGNPQSAIIAYCETALAYDFVLKKSKLMKIFNSVMSEDEVDKHILMMILKGESVSTND
jgi:hypothetical protein